MKKEQPTPIPHTILSSERLEELCQETLRDHHARKSRRRIEVCSLAASVALLICTQTAYAQNFRCNYGATCEEVETEVHQYINE